LLSYLSAHEETFSFQAKQQMVSNRFFFAAFLAIASAAFGQSGQFDWNGAADLGNYPGIKHAQFTVSSPRDMHINCFRIDMTTPGLRFTTTGRMDGWVENSTETMTQTTRDFMFESHSTEKKIIAAINCAPWSPFDGSDWNNSVPVNVSGLAVKEGVLVSRGSGAPSFMVNDSGVPFLQTTSSGQNIDSIHTASSGFSMVLVNGNVVGGGADLHPRTGIGVSQERQYVYFMTIDGRQPASDGATTFDVGSWLLHFGAYTGANMDGGGSTTMAWWDPNDSGADKSTLLNHPRGSGGWSFWDSGRHNGNNLGVYFVAESARFADIRVDGGEITLAVTNMTVGSTCRVERNTDGSWVTVGPVSTASSGSEWSEPVGADWSDVSYRVLCE
jgi:hypothetical protein